jgi:hypothetical protein
VQHHAPALRMRSMLEQINPLPRSQRHPPPDHWDREVRLRQRRANVRRHVVWTFGGMTVAVVILRRKPFEEIGEIQHHIWIGVLLNYQRRRGVLEEYRHQTSLGSRRGYPLGHLASKRIQALPACPNFEPPSMLTQFVNDRTDTLRVE